MRLRGSAFIFAEPYQPSGQQGQYNMIMAVSRGITIVQCALGYQTYDSLKAFLTTEQAYPMRLFRP